MDVYTAIADETRREILERLRTEGPLSVKELSEPMRITRQAVTKHLDLLEKAGLVRSERSGRQRLHRLEAAPLEELDEWLMPYAAAWDRRLSRLRRHLGEADDEE